MKCDKCNNDANIEIYMSDGKEDNKVNLCFDCYQEIVKKGFNDFVEGPVKAFVSSMLMEGGKKAYEMALEQYDMPCPKCGKSLEEIADDKTYGCDYCYSEFSPLIELRIDEEEAEDLEQIESGKVYEEERYQLIDDVKKEIKSKEDELKIFIQDENYEEAAEVKKSLEGLTEKFKSLWAGSGNQGGI